jgi:hypothetical protein
VDLAQHSSAPVEAKQSLGTLRLPAPEQPAGLILRMLARGVPLMLFPDLAWPGRIPADLPAPLAPPVTTVRSAGTTGPIVIVGGTSAGTAAPQPAGQRLAAPEPAGQRLAAPEPAEEEAPAYPGRPDRPGDGPALTRPDRLATGDAPRHEADFSAGREAC